jgi:UDPglucose--hexose-1-phosphate uridylyltransferase
MSVLRCDVPLQDWVIFAPERARRPQEPSESPGPTATWLRTPCPFCPGTEALSPHEIFALREGARRGLERPG